MAPPIIFAAKNRALEGKIKVGAVSYLNTKPLLYGIENSELLQEIELSLEYPSALARKLQNNEIDLALLPVAAMNEIAGSRIISDYGIAANGPVASVCLFSAAPLEEIETVYLDYQSRTSVRLVQLLFKEYWRKSVAFQPAGEDYIEKIGGESAGVIIGDRALQKLSDFPFVYDLAEAWKSFTGLPFVFAAWIANKELPTDFLNRFNAANAKGLDHLDEVVQSHPFPDYDLNKYFRENIQYYLDDQKKMGLRLFLEKIRY